MEFNHKKFHAIIKKAISDKRKGYVCFIDANVLTMAQKDTEYRSILNSSFVNTCDGSSIATLAGWIYKAKFQALNGPEIFETYVEKSYNQILLGSTEIVLDKIKQTLHSKGITTSGFQFMKLPVCSVDEFDYIKIANELNAMKPDIIWVSLGAPKQERFMNKLLQHIDSGVMFGIGAAFNFYIGKLSVPRIAIGRLRFIWLNRLFNEPRKITKRVLPYMIALPQLYWDEKRRKRMVVK